MSFIFKTFSVEDGRKEKIILNQKEGCPWEKETFKCIRILQKRIKYHANIVFLFR
jgi:hypothetical protein